MAEIRIDSVQIGVTDLEEATAAYALLLGVEPDGRDRNRRRFQLARGAVEIEPGEPGLHALRFVVEGAITLPDAGSFHGIDVGFTDVITARAPAAPVEAIDHVVVHTPDPDRAVALWRDRMGLRLALDRVFAERGLRLVFFRSGGITLEYAGAHPSPAERDQPDRFYGVSYRVAGLAAHRERLLNAGVDVSPIRPGMRPGTSVVTVRSGPAGVPTLLLALD